MLKVCVGVALNFCVTLHGEERKSRSLSGTWPYERP
jgi:hypothetical protein